MNNGRPIAAALVSLSMLARICAADAAAPAAPETTPAGLSLEAALAFAWIHHPDMAAARTRILATHGEAVQAALWPRPVLDIARSSEEPGKTADSFALAQKFELGGKRGARIDRAAAAAFLAEADAADRWNEVRAAVKTAYATVAWLTDVVRIDGELAAADDDLGKLRRSMADAGKQDEAGALEAELRAHRTHAALAGAKTALADAERQALAATGMAPPFSNAVVADAAVAAASPLAGEFERLLAAARTNSPALAAAAARTAAARASHAMARASRWPDFSARGAYVAVSRADSDGYDGYSAGFSVDLPLWDRSQGRVAAATEDERAALAGEQAALLRTAASLSSLFAERARWEQEENVLRANVVPAAEKQALLAAALFESGKSSRADLLLTARRLAELRLDHARAELMLAVATAGIERVAGAMVD